MKTWTICFGFLILVTMRATAQDTFCVTLELGKVACNDTMTGALRTRRLPTKLCLSTSLCVLAGVGLVGKQSPYRALRLEPVQWRAE
jgi:hypothetical protein